MTFADSTTTDRLVSDAAAGSAEALEQLFVRHRSYLRRVIDTRLEPALRARVDASDIVQETLVVASQRIDDYASRRPTSFRLWLRQKAMDRLIEARRRHLALKRDARREVSITDATSLLIARKMLHGTSGHALLRRELVRSVRESILQLSELDQEIILLRHAEGLNNAEAAEVLAIEPGAASKRYGRALSRLLVELRKQGFHSL